MEKEGLTREASRDGWEEALGQLEEVLIFIPGDWKEARRDLMDQAMN